MALLLLRNSATLELEILEELVVATVSVISSDGAIFVSTTEASAALASGTVVAELSLLVPIS